MSDVQRYNICLSGEQVGTEPGTFRQEWTPSEAGRWVSYEGHAAVIAEKDAEIKRLRVRAEEAYAELRRGLRCASTAGKHVHIQRAMTALGEEVQP